MVDAIYLRVEVIEDTEQDDTHNLYYIADLWQRHANTMVPNR